MINNINLLDLENNSDECMICKEELNCYDCYTLPECNHKFHTHCLISWFRNGDSRCPYCGNKGINNNNDFNNKYTNRSLYNGKYYHENYIYKDIKKFAYLKKNKDNKQAIKLRDEFEKIKHSENYLINIKVDLKKFKKLLKTQETNYEESRKKLNKLRFEIWNISNEICQMKLNIVNNSYIIPLIIPLPVNIN